MHKIKFDPLRRIATTIGAVQKAKILVEPTYRVAVFLKFIYMLKSMGGGAASGRGDDVLTGSGVLGGC
mgnify:CR=1 FL=1